MKELVILLDQQEEPTRTAPRAAAREPGAAVAFAHCAPPDSHCDAVNANGTGENEICTVFAAQIAGSLTPGGTAAAELARTDPLHRVEASNRRPFACSPWTVERFPRLLETGALEGRI